MSDPDVPQSKRPNDVNDVVDSARAGLDAAAAAGAQVPGRAYGDGRPAVDAADQTPAQNQAPAADPGSVEDQAPVQNQPEPRRYDAARRDESYIDNNRADGDFADSARDDAVRHDGERTDESTGDRASEHGAASTSDANTSDANAAEANAADADLAAFEAAERDFPGTFGLPAGTPLAHDGLSGDAARAGAAAPDRALTPTEAFDREAADRHSADRNAFDSDADRDAFDRDTTRPAVADTVVVAAPDGSIADVAYAKHDADAETRVLPSEPARDTEPYRDAEPAADVHAAPQPIFVQAPEPPRDRGNRGTAGAIGLLAALAFAVLYLGIALGLGALAGDVTLENILDETLAPLTTVAFWAPVVAFFLGFWFLGAIINRGRWGHWVIWGLLVGVVAYGGYLLGQLFEAPFWMITASQGSDLITDSLAAPLAIAAFVLGRELTIWFGAWVARSGARKTELNAEAQREYERTLEAGPSLSR